MNLLNAALPRRSFFAMLPALLTACSAVDVLNATVASDTYTYTYTRTEALAYGPQPRQQLDVYQPKHQTGIALKNAPQGRWPDARMSGGLDRAGRPL